MTWYQAKGGFYSVNEFTNKYHSNNGLMFVVAEKDLVRGAESAGSFIQLENM